jgi:3-keto-disaccharide hydrolase
MNRLPAVLIIVWALVGRAEGPNPPNTLSPQERKQGWVLLWDGKTLNGWESRSGAEWKIVDGAILTDSPKGGTLLTVDEYSDFILSAEFRTTADINAGIYLRLSREQRLSAYELQIRDVNPGNFSGGDYLTGSLVDVKHASADAKIIPGQWNRFEVTAQGDHFVVVYNGKKVLDAHDSKRASGAIGLQWAHPERVPGRKIEFRNLKLRRLKSS